MSVSAVSSKSAAALLDTTGTDTTTGITTNTTNTTLAGKKTLGQDDFLKLLITQFQSQDPMKPMDDTAFIAQMAQFSALQQTQTLTQQMTQNLANQDLATANSYIGRQVLVNAGDGKTASGVVSGVEITDGVPRIVVGDYTYAVSSVLSVAAAPTTSTTTTTPAATTPVTTTPTTDTPTTG